MRGHNGPRMSHSRAAVRLDSGTMEPEKPERGLAAVHHDRSAGAETTRALDATTTSFAEHRELLFSVVYNLLGTVTDTEDVLQDTWLAWAASGREEVATRAPTCCGSP
jgi:hypothetical protein